MPPADARTTIEDLLLDARARLAVASDSPALDAELLVGHVLRRSRASLRAHGDDAVTRHDVARIDALLARRVAGEPVAYLTGHRGFWTLDLEVGPGVLVPRPETELLVEAALERLRPLDAPAILDLGTGSGAIALALAAELPRARIVAIDSSDAALEVARRNAAAEGLDRVRFLRGDWFSPVGDDHFDGIVANPPYLAASDPHLPRLAQEPRTALVSGPTGLEALAAIVGGARERLVAGGWLLLEHGCDQGHAVRALCARAGLQEIATLADAAGLERVTAARNPSLRATAG